jgi:hypothetical protein
MRIGIAALVGGIGLDLVSHVLSLPAIEELAHVAVLVAMVATLLAIVIGSQARPGSPTQQGEPNAVR